MVVREMKLGAAPVTSVGAWAREPAPSTLGERGWVVVLALVASFCGVLVLALAASRSAASGHGLAFWIVGVILLLMGAAHALVTPGGPGSSRAR